MSRAVLALLLFALSCLLAVPASAGETLDAETAFERLAALEGTWRGDADASAAPKAAADEPAPPAEQTPPTDTPQSEEINGGG